MAITEIKKKQISIREAAKKYDLCPSTISRNLKKGKPYQERSYGRPTVLTAEEEKRLADGLLVAAEWGMPFDRMDVRRIVKRIGHKGRDVQGQFAWSRLVQLFPGSTQRAEDALV